MFSRTDLAFSRKPSLSKADAPMQSPAGISGNETNPVSKMEKHSVVHHQYDDAPSPWCKTQLTLHMNESLNDFSSLKGTLLPVFFLQMFHIPPKTPKITVCIKCCS